jgi:hypothetical protein
VGQGTVEPIPPADELPNWPTRPVERRMLPMRKYRKRIHYTETDKVLMWDR